MEAPFMGTFSWYHGMHHSGSWRAIILWVKIARRSVEQKVHFTPLVGSVDPGGMKSSQIEIGGDLAQD